MSLLLITAALTALPLPQAANPVDPLQDSTPRVTLHVDQASALNVLNAVAEQARIKMIVSPEAARMIAGQRLNAYINNQNITDVLHACLESTTNGRFGLEGNPSEGYRLRDYMFLFPGIDHPEHPPFRERPAYIKRKVSLSLIGMTGKEALHQLFRAVGGSYVAEDSLEGAVSINFLNVPFEDALERLITSWQNLKGLGLVSRLHGGVYSISRDPEVGWRNSNVTLRMDNAPLIDVLRAIFNQAEASYVLDADMLRGARVSVDFRNTRLEEAVKIAIKNSKLNPMPILHNDRAIYWVRPENADRAPRPAAATHLSVQLKDSDLRYALKALFVHMQTNYTLDQNISGLVTGEFKEITGQAFLKYLLKCIGHGATYRIEGSVYNFSFASPDFP